MRGHIAATVFAAALLITASGCGTEAISAQRHSGGAAPASADVALSANPAGSSVDHRSVATSPSGRSTNTAEQPGSTSRAAAPTSPAPGSSSSGGADDLRSEIAGTTKVNPADFAGLVTRVGFQSPSGNIACGFQEWDNGSVVCTLRAFTAKAPTVDCQGYPQRPDGISLDAGQGDGTGPAPRFRCISDVETGGPTLPYGSSISDGSLTCASQTGGVTCIDVDTGHGFRIARASYQLVPASADSPEDSDGTDGNAASSTSEPADAAGPSDSSGAHEPAEPRDGNSLAGRYFAGMGTYNMLGSSGNYYGVVFLDDSWAYWGRPKGGLPTCTTVTATAQPSDRPSEGWGCAHYSFDPASGALTVGQLSGSYRDGRLTINKFSFVAAQIPDPGTTFDVSLENLGYSGMCGPYGGCSTWSNYLAMSSDGTFVLSTHTINSGFTPGVGGGWAASFPPDQHGTYRVEAGARLVLSFANKTKSVRTIAVQRDKQGNPDPADVSGDGGLVIDDLTFWRDDDD